MPFEHFPYTNMHDLNLDWILQKVKEAYEKTIASDEKIDDLREYVKRVVEGLDVPAVVADKLDEMLDNGTLATIIHENTLHGSFYKPMDLRESYKDNTLRVAVSYIVNELDSHSFTGTVVGRSNTPFKAVYSDGNKTYAGFLGQGSGFVTDDVDGAGNHIAYLDCSGFVTLCTKGRLYEQGPYYYGFTATSINELTMYTRCLEYGDNFSRPWTIDWHNWIDTSKMAFISIQSGNPLTLVASHAYGSDPVYHDAMGNLETGDILFFANPANTTERFMGIGHCAIYVKSMEDLAPYFAEYEVIPRVVRGNNDDPNGLIIHVSTAIQGADVIRIEGFSQYMESLSGTNTRYCYGSKPYANALNSSKGLKAISGLMSNYNNFSLGSRFNAEYTPNITYYRKRAQADQFGIKGAPIPNGSDLDTLPDGFYYNTTETDLSTISHLPQYYQGSSAALFKMNLVVMGTDKYNGLQVIFGSNRMFIRTHLRGSIDWTDWHVVQIDAE